jgi:hypothetical protein
MQQFLVRVWGAATLNAAIYEEVEADSRATLQAVAVIALGSLAAGFGATGWNANPSALMRSSAVIGCLGLMAWIAWAFVTFEIGSRLLPERETRVNVPQLLRTLGFSAAPALCLALGAFGVTTAVFAATTLWMLAAMVVAVRQALDYRSTARALAVCTLGWLLTLILVVVLGLIFGPSLA